MSQDPNGHSQDEQPATNTDPEATPPNDVPANSEPEPEQSGAPADQNLSNDGYATQEGYDENAADTKDLTVPEGGERFNVSQIPPFKFAGLLEEYDLQGLGSKENLESIPDDLTTDDDSFEETLALVGFMRDIVVPNINRPRHAYWGRVPGWMLTDGSLLTMANEAEQKGFADRAEALRDAHEEAERFVQSLDMEERERGVLPRQLPHNVTVATELFDVSNMSTRDTMYLLGGITGQDPDEMLEEGLSAMEKTRMGEGDNAKFRRQQADN